MAVIDYAGFNDLTEAIGGVDVYVPETVEDTQQDVTWEQGWTHLEGERALQYVRTRHGLLEGDFDRIDRQQNFLRAVLRKTLADGTIGNPTKLSNTLGAITDHLAVDSSWSTKDLRGLAFSLRGIDASKVRFMTLPLLALPGPSRASAAPTSSTPRRPRGSGRRCSTTRSGPTSRTTPTTSCPTPGTSASPRAPHPYPLPLDPRSEGAVTRSPIHGAHVLVLELHGDPNAPRILQASSRDADRHRFVVEDVGAQPQSRALE